jgi:hypothetical protein
MEDRFVEELSLDSLPLSSPRQDLTRVSFFGDEFDDVDFEMALCCFEATHRLAFKQSLVDVPVEQYEELSLEEFIENYLDLTEQKSPLFVAQRFRMFEEALTRAIVEEQQGPGEF